MFVPSKPFQPSLMFAGKAGAYLSGASEKCFTRVCSGITRKHKTRLERLARDKRSCLLQKLINYGCKKFYNIGPRSHQIWTGV